MKKTRILFSFMLAFIMLISTVCGTSITALASGWLSYAESVDLNEEHQIVVSYDDYYDYQESEHYFNVLKFDIPCDGTVNFKIWSENKIYLLNDYFYIYNENNLNNYIDYYWASSKTEYNSSTGEYVWSVSLNLSKGRYYFVIENYARSIDKYWGYATFYADYKPNIAKPSSLKTQTRSANSLKLSWSKVGNVNGYQLQRKSGDTYKTITNTTSTSYTVKDLSSATNYTFRVRAYKTVDGKKYYSSWNTLTTPTKPAKVSIKTPATNTKHQVIAKWNTVARANGYQIQYCKNSSCSNVIATKTVSGQSKKSYTGKNFTKGKTYYVRVRAYKTVNGTKYYSAWSSVKSIKCK